jgi:hypothetical protein
MLRNGSQRHRSARPAEPTVASIARGNAHAAQAVVARRGKTDHGTRICTEQGYQETAARWLH